MHSRTLYESVINEWLLNHLSTDSTKLILKRGIWCCINPPEVHRGIMIAGINPSYDKNHIEEPKDCTFMEVTNANCSSYWHTKRQMVRGLGIPTSYIDLFPLRLTKQDAFMDDSIVPLELKVELLKVTQRQIEMIHPKLIVNPNMASRIYWGLHERYSWMGYDMKTINNPIKKGTLYKIEGIKEKPDIILPELQTTLVGSYFLQYKYHGNGALSKEEYLTNTDIYKLWNYIEQI